MKGGDRYVYCMLNAEYGSNLFINFHRNYSKLLFFHERLWITTVST